MFRRFDKKMLGTIDRPKAIYYYFVTGFGEFPLDMLRYDCCWPCSGEDVTKLVMEPIDRTDMRSIHLASYREPTVDRWNSFHWSVGTQNLERTR